MKIPTTAQTQEMIDEARRISPGPWIEHSEVVALTAKRIAENCPDLDPEIAYILGLLHDIGRREGWTHILHTLDGYKYLMNQGYDDAAHICLTHSFPISEVSTYHGTFDCTDEDLKFLQDYLNSHPLNDYDKLIQLCDAISLPHGAVLMEKRLVDVVLRHGLPEWTLRKWKKFFELKDYFDSMTNSNIYRFIPNIEQNTFEW
jgi:hypothetical protein